MAESEKIFISLEDHIRILNSIKFYTDNKQLAVIGLQAELEDIKDKYANKYTVYTKEQIDEFGFLSEHQDITGKADKEYMEMQLAGKQDALTAGEGIKIEGNVISGTFDFSLFKLVTELPEEDINPSKIYLVKDKESESDSNSYIEYVYVDGVWEELGRFHSSIDLSEYITKDEAARTYATKVDLDSKLDKAGGTISGNLNVRGKTTFNDKVTFPTGGNNGTVLDIPGNLGIGSETNKEVTGRITTSRITMLGNLVVSKSSIGYNPKVNQQSTTDYGMKYQVQYGSNVNKQDSACFYLSYSGCLIGLSGNPTKGITEWHEVLHDGLAYKKVEIDQKIAALEARLQELENK